jgi:hypothetical protein
LFLSWFKSSLHLAIIQRTIHKPLEWVCPKTVYITCNLWGCLRSSIFRF